MKFRGRQTAGFFLFLIFLIFIFGCKQKTENSFSLEPGEGFTFSSETLGKEGTLISYTFKSAEDEEARIIMSPQGLYDAALNAGSFMMVKTREGNYSLDQFSETLFRPDLIVSLINGEEAVQGTESLGSILRKKAPLLSIPITGELLKISAQDQGGGIGRLVLFNRETPGMEIPLAFYDANTLIKKTYKEKGKKIYELEFPLPAASANGFAISIFNAEGTMESERLFFETDPGETNISETGRSEIPASAAEKKPQLHIINFLPDSREPITSASETLISLFTPQEEGSLYSKVLFHDPLPDTLFENIQIDDEDVFIMFLPPPTGLDQRGDLIFPLASANRSFGKWDLAEYISKIKTKRGIVLIPPSPSMSEVQERTGFSRLQNWLAPVLAMFPMEILDEAVKSSMKDQYLNAGDLFGFAQERGHTLVSVPFNDFPLLDRWLGFGEIRMQSLASGSVIIDDFDKSPSPLGFGETLVRKLPAGLYSVSMIYRNGRRETKTAAVESQGFSWVIFNYVPDLSAADFQGALPLFGVNIAELNPRNYQKVDAPVLLNMGMEPGYVALLAGNKFYESGDFNKAIAEYTKAIGLKADYADAYAWRGNAYRKNGDAGKAMDDYTRALRYKNNYPEVYNYRGFLYSQRGDYDRAVSDYTQAIKQKPDYADALFNRAFAYGKKGDYEKAIADYTQLIKLESSNAAAYSERGRAWQSRGNREQAEADFAMAEKLRSR